MGIAHQVVVGMGRTLEGVRAGTSKLIPRRLDMAPTTQQLVVTSPAFTGGGPLPISASIDGEGAAPPLRWSGVPASARSVAVVCEDPDAPLPEPFVHWMVYGMPSTIALLEGTAAGFPEGLNSKLMPGFTPAAPPPGHGEHHYHFQVFALDTMLELPEGSGRTSLTAAMRGHVVAWGELVGTYERT